MRDIDFSHFSDEVRRSIESAARFASRVNSNMITPCHLMGGLVDVNGSDVYYALKQAGFDPDATLESIASGMSDNALNDGTSGMGFHPAVENALALAASLPTEVDVKTMVKVLVENAECGLDPYLFVAEVRYEDEQTSEEQPAAEPTYDLGEPRDYKAEDSTTGKTIKKFCINMLEQAACGIYHHAIGRDEELKRVFLILARSTKNNPILVGEPGTGKTAIAEELALRLLYRQVPAALQQIKLYSLEYSSIKVLPDALGVMKSILEEAASDPNIVFFIDEAHMLISNSAYTDNDIANLLKPAMARGDIKILGATTLDEYKRIEKDAAFERRFQMVTVDEPDIDSSIRIIEGSKHKFEEHHDVIIPSEVCKAVVNLSARYITNRRLPDKAFDLIDLAAADVRLNGGGRRVLEVNDVMKIITIWTGIPVDKLDDSQTQRLQNIENELHASVIGQDKAIKEVADAIRRSRMGLGDPTRPIGSFLFLGSTGTGKTELCKAIARFLFNDENSMVRIDMSEFQQAHSSHRLFGAPPSYVGYEDGGQLTEAVYRKPYSVILFDEIEKAHPKVFDTLLQILDEGRMTDGKGKVVNFKNTIIVMTSNLGQDQILSSLLGPNVTDSDVERCTESVMDQLKQTVKPEFINRIDNIVMFMPLSREDVAQVALLCLKKEQAKLKENNMEIHFDPDVVKYIVQKGYQPEYGGRPVKKAINNYILDPLAAAVVDGTIDKSLPINISLINNEIVFSNGTPSGV